MISVVSHVENITYVQQSSVTHVHRPLVAAPVQRRTDAQLSHIYTIVHNLILIEPMKCIKWQRSLVHIQWILVNKKYYEMSLFPHATKSVTPNYQIVKNNINITLFQFEPLSYQSRSAKVFLIRGDENLSESKLSLWPWDKTSKITGAYYILGPLILA